MGFFRWLNRLAGKADDKLEPTSVAVSGRTAPVVAEIQKEEQEEEIEKP
ncbi:MAG: hypothetical protein ACRDNM_06295 [Gaiellaceae bacterium]